MAHLWNIYDILQLWWCAFVVFCREWSLIYFKILDGFILKKRQRQSFSCFIVVVCVTLNSNKSVTPRDCLLKCSLISFYSWIIYQPCSSKAIQHWCGSRFFLNFILFSQKNPCRRISQFWCINLSYILWQCPLSEHWIFEEDVWAHKILSFFARSISVKSQLALTFPLSYGQLKYCGDADLIFQSRE